MPKNSATPKLIIVSGFAGSGKSTLADSLGRELGLRVVHASSILREMATKGVKALENASPQKIHDWWESDEAKRFMAKRNEDGSMDRALDKKLMQIAGKGGVILDSWTMSYLYKGKAFRVWLEASPEVRAERVSGRDNLDYGAVLEKIKARDADTKALYQRLYNFTMGEQLGKFDLVIDTGAMAQEQVFEMALGKIKGKSNELRN
ncbi:Cytidylate kinase [uncultured archaeon]|nr:Cytidylate kinase [uncultured archaeon]